MINFTANAFLYSQDSKDIKRQLTFDHSDIFCFIPLRQYKVVKKLYNLIFYITHLFQQKTIFDKYQEENLALIDHDKIYAYIYENEVKWNLIYMMIE